MTVAHLLATTAIALLVAAATPTVAAAATSDAGGGLTASEARPPARQADDVRRIEAWIDEARQALAADNMDEARRTLDEADQALGQPGFIFPDRAGLRLRDARQALERNDHAEAEQSLTALESEIRTGGGRDSGQAGLATGERPATGKAGTATPEERADKLARLQTQSADIVGESLYNLNNEEVGAIRDILVDHAANQAYFIVEVGGFLGLGAKQVAISADRVEVMAGQALLRSAQTEDDLEHMAAFDKSQQQWESIAVQR